MNEKVNNLLNENKELRFRLAVLSAVKREIDNANQPKGIDIDNLPEDVLKSASPEAVEALRTMRIQ